MASREDCLTSSMKAACCEPAIMAAAPQRLQTNQSDSLQLRALPVIFRDFTRPSFSINYLSRPVRPAPRVQIPIHANRSKARHQAHVLCSSPGESRAARLRKGGKQRESLLLATRQPSFPPGLAVRPYPPVPERRLLDTT